MFWEYVILKGTGMFNFFFFWKIGTLLEALPYLLGAINRRLSQKRNSSDWKGTTDAKFIAQ
jgi:hypothetical protein